MALYYHKAHTLGALFPELYRLLKAERRGLKPQTPQTIIVGSLDVEAWIEEQFIGKDGVLMGVHFPFLETAIETFAERRAAALFPGAHESWFTPPVGTERQKKAGMLQLELAVFDALLAARTADKTLITEYNLKDLGSLQLLTLSQRVAREIREYLLHAPEAMEKMLKGKATSAIAKIWKSAHASLKAAGYASGMFAASENKNTNETPSLFTSAQGGSLYLFGMPILSAYHVRRLCDIATTVDVHVMTVHPHREEKIANTYYLAVSEKFEAYSLFIRKSAAAVGATFSEKSHTSAMKTWQAAWLKGEAESEAAESPVEFLKLPGLWRGAEIIADLWHEKLRASNELRQDDFALMLTAPAAQYPAFDKACGSRRLSLFARNRLFERPQAIVELMAILAAAASDGIDRDLLVRYFSNPVVRTRFRLDSEKTNLYIRSLSEANGFRNDYPGALGVFNLTSALQRLRLGLLVEPANAQDDISPGATYIRSLDTAETLAEFIACVEVLILAPTLLKSQPGAELVKQWLTLIARFQDTPAPEATALSETLTAIAAMIPEHEITAQQVARIVARNTAGKNLAQGAQRQGICASPLSAPAPFRRSVTLWDMSEDLDNAPEKEDGQLAEYLLSPTRLKRNEQVAIHLVLAALGESEALQIAYSGFDAETGAEKYRSVEIERFKASLRAGNVAFNEKENFAQTIFDTGKGFAANAADAEVTTLRLSYEKKGSGTPLAGMLLPTLAASETTTELSLKNLIAYAREPFHYFYKRLTALPEDPADFRYAEPKLAETKGTKFLFAENFIKNTVLSPRDGQPISPLQLLAADERRGITEPEGFDFMRRLLSSGENEQILRDLAIVDARRFQIVEYVLDARIQAPFSVKEANRLTRHYLPAPIVGGIQITGTSDKFLTTLEDNQLHAIGSSREKGDKDRTRECIGAYVQLAAILLATRDHTKLAPAGISLFYYKITAEGETEPPTLAIKRETKFIFDAAKINAAEKYLQSLTEAIRMQQAPYFTAALLGKNKLAGFAAKTTEEIVEALAKENEKQDSEDFIAEFYQPDLGDEAGVFFDRFIRPVAEIDAVTAKPRGGKKK